MLGRLLAALLAVATLALASTPVAAGDSTSGADDATTAEEESRTEKEKAIRKLLKVTGTPEIGMRLAERVFEDLKESHPDAPPEFWEKFESEMRREAFIDRLVPVYKEHFSKDEIDKLLDFYKTDVGQKYVEKLPIVARRAQEAGRRWGQELGQRIVDRLNEKGY